jgi:hypothetical protein
LIFNAVMKEELGVPYKVNSGSVTYWTDNEGSFRVGKAAHLQL